MELNSLFFPAPKYDKNQDSVICPNADMIWVPKRKLVKKDNNTPSNNKQQHKKNLSISNVTYPKNNLHFKENKNKTQSLKTKDTTYKITKKQSLPNNIHFNKIHVNNNNSNQEIPKYKSYKANKNISISLQTSSNALPDSTEILQESKKILNNHNIQMNTQKDERLSTKYQQYKTRQEDFSFFKKQNKNISTVSNNSSITSSPNKYLTMLSTRITFQSLPKANSPKDVQKNGEFDPPYPDEVEEEELPKSFTDSQLFTDPELTIMGGAARNKEAPGKQMIRKKMKSRTNSFVTLDHNDNDDKNNEEKTTNITGQKSEINSNNGRKTPRLQHQQQQCTRELLCTDQSFISGTQFNDIEEHGSGLIQATSPKSINEYKTKNFKHNSFKKHYMDLDEFDCYEVKGIHSFRQNKDGSTYNFVKQGGLMQSINQIHSNYCSPRHDKYFNSHSIGINNVNINNTDKRLSYNPGKSLLSQQIYEDDFTKEFKHGWSNDYKINGHIPCLYLESERETPYLLIYFHGNGEDVFRSQELLDHLRCNLEVNILAMEYPGYGVYPGSPNDEKIQEDAEDLYKYLRVDLKLKPKQIMLLGRSIGSGPATYLASKYDVGCLILVSPFTSIRGVVEHLVGKFASLLVKERFQNIENIKKVKAPVFFVHGKRDRLVPYEHSLALQKKCRAITGKNIPEYMTHTEFHFTDDLSIPIYDFLYDNGIDLDLDQIEYEQFVIPQFPVQLFKKNLSPQQKRKINFEKENIEKQLFKQQPFQQQQYQPYQQQLSQQIINNNATAPFKRQIDPQPKICTDIDDDVLTPPNYIQLNNNLIQFSSVMQSCDLEQSN